MEKIVDFSKLSIKKNPGIDRIYSADRSCIVEI